MGNREEKKNYDVHNKLYLDFYKYNKRNKYKNYFSSNCFSSTV